MRLCQPLAPHCRDALLRLLAYQLRGRRDVGDGELHRLARTIIKDNHLFDAPLVWRNLASFGSLNSFREFTGDT
jgi:hypothetical protein